MQYKKSSIFNKDSFRTYSKKKFGYPRSTNPTSDWSTWINGYNFYGYIYLLVVGATIVRVVVLVVVVVVVVGSVEVVVNVTLKSVFYILDENHF